MNIAMISSAREYSNVIVVDDDDLARQDLITDLEDAGYNASAVEGPYGNQIDLLVDEVSTPDTFVICDHRLSPSGLASFTGAEVVARLFDKCIPAMLLTMYQSTDWARLGMLRKKVPVIVPRDSFEIEKIPSFVDTCIRELRHEPIPERMPHRSLIRIEEFEGEGAERYLVAVVPSWRKDHAIRIPAALLDQTMIDSIQNNSYLLANVNIDALREEDLFFSDFTIVLHDVYKKVTFNE